MLTIDEVSAIEAINLHLDEQPDDWDARRILADLYMDVGDEDRSKTQMWLADNKKSSVVAVDKLNSHIWAKRPWAWWSRGCENDCSVLHSLAACIPPMNYANGGYTTRQEAEDSLMGELINRDFQSIDVILEQIRCGK